MVYQIHLHVSFAPLNLFVTIKSELQAVHEFCAGFYIVNTQSI